MTGVFLFFSDRKTPEFKMQNEKCKSLNQPFDYTQGRWRAKSNHQNSKVLIFSKDKKEGGYEKSKNKTKN